MLVLLKALLEKVCGVLGLRNFTGQLRDSTKMLRDDEWNTVPLELHYLRPWVDAYGLLGRTSYPQDPLHKKRLSRADIRRLEEAFLLIEKKQDFDRINNWCDSVEPMTVENEVACPMLGLLFLFDRYGEAGHEPFCRVKAIPEETPQPFDWTIIPTQFHDFVPYLIRYDDLRTEGEVYDYATNADAVVQAELVQLRLLIKRQGDSFRSWLDKQPDSSREAFQAGWLFLLEYFSRK